MTPREAHRKAVREQARQEAIAAELAQPPVARHTTPAQRAAYARITAAASAKLGNDDHIAALEDALRAALAYLTARECGYLTLLDLRLPT